MVDSNGRLVAGPLRRGAPYCMFHARPFTYFPAVPMGPLVILLIDLETTGTSVGHCRIVELAAAQAFDPAELPGACFAQVVRVPAEVLQKPEAQAAAAVHRISEIEIETSRSFPSVWAMFLDFVERLLNDCVQDDSDSEQDQSVPTRMPDEPPVLVLAAHNGYRFDFAVLLAEIIRHELSLSPLRRWLFVDTLSILDATKDVVGTCLKLQCLVRHNASPKDLRAHRATRLHVCAIHN